MPIRNLKPGDFWPFVLFPSLKLLIQLLAIPGYGIFRDELYYIACSERLALGYVDQPPLCSTGKRCASKPEQDKIPSMPGHRRKHDKNVKANAVKHDGGLVVSFVNTAAGGRRPWTDYAGFLAWARQQQVMKDARIDHFEALAAERPEEADAAFANAIELHGHLSSIFNALADREAPPQSAIEGLESHLNRRPPRRLLAGEGCFRWTWDDDLLQPLLEVMSSAMAVLTSKKLCGRVARCARKGCGTLFVALNQGSPRKWCGMQSCGSRASSRRHYHGKVKPRKEERRERVEESFRKLMDDPEGARRDFEERVRRIRGD